MAATLKADSCEIYTDVEGVFTADPRIVPNAVKLYNVSYDEMLEFSNLGAGVLHNKCVKIAKENNIRLIVRSSLSKEVGTMVSSSNIEDSTCTKITGVTAHNNVVSIVGKNIDTETKEKVVKVLNEKRSKV